LKITGADERGSGEWGGGGRTRINFPCSPYSPLLPYSPAPLLCYLPLKVVAVA